MIKRILKLIYRFIRPVFDPKRAILILRYIKYASDYNNYKKLGGKVSALDVYPCLGDDTNSTSFDAQYLYQSIWAFKQIIRHSPTRHHDIGSDIRFAGPLSTLVDVEFVDIRPAELNVSGFTGTRGSVIDLPYADGSLTSLSCLHVIEHIGLGRYGDPLDPYGSEKAFREILRVLAINGQCLISVPIGKPKIEFNAHRVFSMEEIQTLTDGLTLLSIAIVDEQGRYIEKVELGEIKILEEESKSSFLGLFAFTKNG